MDKDGELPILIKIENIIATIKKNFSDGEKQLIDVGTTIVNIVIKLEEIEYRLSNLEKKKDVKFDKT